ncbi:hypothetical protein E3N88_39678 [Mikania micrantha]|uniref:Aminotransferase-like plant mobile domain-containing protein n=1 Tax=Mikania micrantha TaxID=192012 RepID=A0A5N6LLD0_9ASTR|nr:hypothetical protein E3N88_39678 [Mikania micrantha]
MYHFMDAYGHDVLIDSGPYEMTMLKFEADQKLGFWEDKRSHGACSNNFSLDTASGQPRPVGTSTVIVVKRLNHEGEPLPQVAVLEDVLTRCRLHGIHMQRGPQPPFEIADSHRARDIFNNKETKNLVFRRADQKFFSLFNNNPITENVKRYVNIAGFGGLLDCGYRNLDHGLLEALIERWRPETHTFHLPIGEATVTLEDVNVLWGLPIEGGVVSGCENSSTVANRIVRCQTLLVSLSILNNLENLTACGQLSWGSAVLAVLYRNLCKATSSNANNIGGPMYILQLWAWCRITTIAPRILHPFDNTRPYGAIGIRSWQSECYVIYWDVVEFYTPQRVMRQFGMVQHIPSPFHLSINDHMKLHTLTRSGKPERNWMNTHLEYVTVWNQRWQNVIQGVRCATPTVEPNYMQWFWSRTVLYITNPKSQELMQPVFQDHGSRSQFLMDGISQTYQQVGGYMQTDSTSNFHNFGLLQNTANQVMEMVNEGSRLRYPTHLQSEPVNLGGDDTVPRSLRRRDRRRGNLRSGAGTSGVQHEPGTSHVEHENYEAGTSHVQHENYEVQASEFSSAPSPSFFAGLQSNIMFQDNNEQDVYTPHASMLPLFNQSQSEDFNYYAPQFSPIQTHGFSGISPLPSLDLNLHMSVGELDDDTLLAHTTLNTEDDDQNQIASRRRNPQRHRRRPGCGT